MYKIIIATDEKQMPIRPIVINIIISLICISVLGEKLSCYKEFIARITSFFSSLWYGCRQDAPLHWKPTEKWNDTCTIIVVTVGSGCRRYDNIRRRRWRQSWLTLSFQFHLYHSYLKKRCMGCLLLLLLFFKLILFQTVADTFKYHSWKVCH